MAQEELKQEQKEKPMETPKKGKIPGWGKGLIGGGIAIALGVGAKVAHEKGVLPEPLEKPYDTGKKVVQEVGQEIAQATDRALEKVGVDIIKTDESVSTVVRGKANLTPQKAQETTEATEKTKEFIPEIRSKLLLNNVEMPMWYLENSGMEWGSGNTEFVVSAVVVGPPKKSIGESNKEELMIPVAFQNPITKDYYVRDLSLGTPEVYQYGFGMVDLKNHSFLRPGDSYTAYIIKTENLIERLKTGDQIAFTLLISLKSWDEKVPSDYKKTSEYKTVYEFYTLYLSNNNAVIEAMKQNEELTNEIICPNMFFINK